MSADGRQRGRCRQCGRRMRSSGDFVCSPCRGHKPLEGKEFVAPAYCDWCGRWHGERQVCRDRAERSAVSVRLWLAGLAGLREEPGDE